MLVTDRCMEDIEVIMGFGTSEVGSKDVSVNPEQSSMSFVNTTSKNEINRTIFTYQLLSEIIE